MATTRAIIDVSINTSDAAAQIRNLQTQINSFNATLQKTNTVQALTAKSLTQNLLDAVNASRSFTAEQVRMETSARRLDQTLTKGQGTLAQYFNARFRKDSAEAAAVLSLANARAQALETQFIKTTSAANGFRDAVAIRPLAAFNDSTAVANERLVIHRAMLRQATTSMINFGKNTQWAGRQLMVGFTVPLTIFGTTAGRTFKEIDQAAVRFKKVYGDAFTPPEEIQKNMDAVKGLAAEFTKYGIAVKDTIDLAAEVAAAGAKNADLIAATTEATRLGTLGQLEQQEALTATIALQNAFKLSSVQLREEVNFLNMVENQTVVTLQDLTEAIPRVAPVIVGLGGDVRDLAAMMAAMQEGGVSAAQGANALKSGLGSLINPSRKASEELAKMGISIDSIVQANRGDLMGTVKAFGEALSGLDQFTRQQALEELFGKYQYARLGALFDNIIKDGTQASRVLQISGMSARDMAASAEKELSAISEATSTKFLAAIERFKLSIAPVGEMFMKLATPIVNFFAMLAEKFNSLPDFAKNLAGIATVFIGVVIPAGTMFLGLLMNLIGTLSKFGSMFTSAFQGMRQGGIGGGIRAISQSLNYMGLQEMDAANAATQLGQSTSLANDALVNQVSAAQDAEAAIKLLTDAYQMLIEKQMSVAQLSTSLFGAGASAASAAAGRAAQSPPTVEEQLSLFDVQGRNRGGRIFTLNSGNRVPGSGNTDTVPAMLTPGEFVVNKQATQQNLPLLQAINSGNKVSGFNKGGKIPGVQYFGTPGSPGGPVRFSDLEQRMAHEKEIAARLGMRQPISQASMANPNPGQASDYVLLSSVDNPTVLRTISDRMAAYFGTTVLGSYGSNVGLAPGKSGSDINRDLKFGRASAVDVQQMTGLVDYYLGTFRDVPAAAMALAGLGLTPLQGAEKISSALSSRIGKIRSKVLIGDADLWEETRLAYSAAGLDPLFAALETERGAIRYALPQEISASLRGGGQDDTIHGAALESVFGAGNISRTRDSSGRLIYVISGSAVGYPQNIGVRPGLTESMPSGGFNYENISKSIRGLTRIHMAPPQALNKGGLAGIQYFGTQDGNAGGGKVGSYAGDPAHSRFEVEVYADDGSVIGSVLARGNMSDILVEYFNGIDEAERITAFDTIKRHASTLAREDRQYSQTLEQSYDISILNSLLPRKIQEIEASHFAHMTQRRGEFVSRYGIETGQATNLRLNEGGTTGKQWLDDTYPGEIIKTGFQRHILTNAGIPEDQINAASEEIDKKIIKFLKNYKNEIFTDSGEDVKGERTYEVGKMISPLVDPILKKYNVSDTKISDLKTRNVRRRTKAQKRAQSAAQIQELMSGGPVNAVTAAAQQLQMYGYNSLTNEQKAILKGASEDVGSMPLFKGSSLLSPNIPSSLRDAIMSGNPDSLIGSIIQTPMGSYSESESIAAPFMYDNGETRRLKEIYQELFKSSYMIKDKNGKFVKPKTGKEALEARRLEMTTLPFHLDDPSYTDDDRIRINSEIKGYPPSLYHSETPRLEKLAEEYDQLLAMGGGKGVIYRIKPGSSDLPPGQSKITDISTDKNVTTVTLETGKLLATPVSKLGGTPVMPGGTDLLRDEKEWHVGSFKNGGKIPDIQHLMAGNQVKGSSSSSTGQILCPGCDKTHDRRDCPYKDLLNNKSSSSKFSAQEIASKVSRGELDIIGQVIKEGTYAEFASGIKSLLRHLITYQTDPNNPSVNQNFVKRIEQKYGVSGAHWKMGDMIRSAISTGDSELIDLVEKLFPSYTAGMRSQNDEEKVMASLLGPELLKNSGGLIPGIQYFANAGQVGKTFLGMPHSFNPKIATRYSALARSDEMLQTGRWADMPISDIGTQITSIGGFSSTLPGINGVYEIDGKRFVIKAHETPDSALLESRSSQLMRDLFGLESPEQEFIKFRHPQTGQLVSGVRSPYDERFASSASAIDPDSFVRQLIASAIRRDSDLQPDNLWNNVLADSGAAILGVSATGKPSAMTDRTITTSPRPVSEQVDINLLKSKGGAKKWFAEESANIARNITEDEYVNGILQEISQVRERLNSSLDSLIIGTPEEKATYRAILERDLAELEAYDWRSTYQHHVGLYPEAKKPPTAAAIAKKEKEAQERARQTGANTGMKYGIPWVNKGGLIPGIQYFANAGIVKRLMNSGLDRGQLQRKLVSDNQWDDLDDDLKRQVMEWDAAGNTGFGIFGAAYRARSQQQGDREAAKKAERQSGAYLPLKTLAMTDLDFGDADGVLRLMRSGELDEADQAFLIDYIKEGLDYGRLKDFHTQARQYHGQYYDTAMSSLVAEAQKIGNPKLIEALVRLTGIQAKNTGGLIPGVQYFGTQMPGRVVKEVGEQLALFGSSTPIVAKSKEDELNDIVEHFSTTVMRGGSKVQLHTFLKKWGKGGEAVLQYIKMNPAFFQHNPRGVDPDAPFRSGPQGELFGVTRFSGTGLHSFAATESGLIDDLISYVMKQENIPYFKYDPGPSGTSAGGLRLVDRLLDEGIIKDSLARDLASGNVNKLTREDALMMIENARQIGLLPETRQIITNKNTGGLIQHLAGGSIVGLLDKAPGHNLTTILGGNLEQLSDYIVTARTSENYQEVLDDVANNLELFGLTFDKKGVDPTYIDKMREHYGASVEGYKIRKLLDRVVESGNKRLIDFFTKMYPTYMGVKTGKKSEYDNPQLDSAFAALLGPELLKNKGGLIQFFKNGGDVAAMKAFATKPLFESRKRTRVPGSGNTDTVPAALTPGEFVINKKATQENLPLLQAINNGKIARAFTGGEITNDGVNTTSMPPLPAGMNPKAVKSRESTGVGIQPQSRISQGILAADTSDVLAVTPEEYRSYMPIIYPNVPPDVMAKLIEINIEKIFKDGRVRLGATTGTMTPDRVNPEELAFSISRSDVYEDQLSEEDKGRVFNEKSRIALAFGEGPSSLQQHDVLTHNPYTQLFEIVHAKRLKSIYNELLAANSEHVAGLSFQDFIKKVVGKGGLSSTVVGSAIAKAELDQPFIRAVNEAYARIAYGLSPEDEIPLFRASTGTGGQIVSSLYKEANPGREATARQELLSTGERLTTGWWTYSPSLASSFVESPTGFPLLTTNVKVRDLPQIFNSSGYADERGMVFNAREDQRARFAFEEDRAALIEIDKLQAELKSGVSREREGAITARVYQLKSEISKRQGKSDNGKSPRGFDLREVLRPVMIPFSATQSPEAQIKMSEWRKAKPDTGRPGGVIKFDQASGSYYVDFSYLGVNKLSNSELLLVDLLQDGLGLNLLEMIMPDGTFKPVKLNKGNMVPGFGNGDTVPAMLTPGEFVVNKQATQKNLGLLHAINNGNPIMANRGGRIGINYLQTGGEAEQLAFQFDGSLQAAAEASDQMAISVREVTKGLNKYRDLIPDDVTKAAVEKNDTEEKASEESPGQMSLFNMPPPSQAVTQISEQLDLFSDEDIKKMQEDAQKAREDAIVAMIKLEGDFDKQRTQALEQYNNQRLQIETQFLENVRTIEEQGAREAAKRQADIAANKKSIDEATDENAKRGLQERLALLELEQSQHEQTMETRKRQAAQDRENSLKRAEQDQADTQRLINLADEQTSALDEMTIGGESITGLKKRFKEASLKQKTTIGLGAATTLVGGASLAASQFGGAFGIDTKGFAEVTGKVTEGLGLMTTAASMLPGPAGLVAAAIVGVGYALKAVTDNANKMAAEAAKAGANLGATADSLKIVSAMLGTETPIQRMAKLRTGLTPQISKQLSENEKYQSMIGSEQGKKFLEELKNTTSEERMKKVGDMIAYGIASGAMTKEDATLFGKGIAAELNDPALAAQIGRNIAKQIEGSKGISQLGDQRSIALTQTKILEKATAKIQDPLIQFNQMQRSSLDDFMNSSFMNIAQFTPGGALMKAGYSIGAALPAPGEIRGINAEDSAKYISGALQAIQDYSNAIALAKEELTSGKISQTEYNSIVADASGKIKELENGMQTAGLASENISTTMGAVMTQLVDSGALTEEQFKNLEAAANATGTGFDDSRALVLSSLSAMAGGAMDAATALDLIAQISGTGLYEGQETAAKKYFDKTKGQLGAAQAQSGALVASQIESGALINPDILKKLGRGNQDKGSQQIIDFLQKLQTGVPNFDVTAFQDFYSKINDKNMVKIQPIIQNLKPEEVQAFMTQFNTAASYYGDDFANKLLTSPQTIAAAKEGGGAFQRAIGQAAEAGVKQTVVEALFVQNGRPRPWKDIEKDLKSYATYQKNIDKLPEEIRKVLKIDTEDPADVLKYGKTDMATIEANWTLLDKLPNNINKQAVASFIMTDETGKARSAQEVIKKIVDVEKWYGKLSKKGVNKIQTGIQIIQTMVDQEGNSIGNTPEEIKNNAQALVAELKNVYGAGKINKLPPEVYIATLQLKVNLQGIDEMIKAKRVLYNIAVGDGNFEEAKKISDELKNLVAQRNAIQSEIDLNMSRDYKQSGGGGGGAKSLLQQLKDNIKMFKEYFNNLKKLINDNRNLRFVNQDILNVPFSNDFLKYLTDNMEEANKIFKKGTDGIKKLYDAFVQDQLAQSKVYTMMLRNQNVAETDAINAKRKFTQELMGLGITNPDILSTILESVNPETLKLRNKGLARKNPKKRTTQEQDAIDIVNQAIVGQRQESVARSVANINTELDNQGASLNRVNGLLSLNSQLSQYGARVTLEQAQMLSEMGVTVDQVTANMVEFASIMERANAIKFAESIQQANDGLEKMRDQATRTKNVTKALGEDVNTELIQSLTSAMEADPNPNSWDANRIKQYADAWKYAQQQIEGAKDRFTQAIELSDALTKSFQQQIEKINRLEIKPIEKSIKALEDSIEPIQNEIEALQDKETELQKVYDERIKALEQVETINQRIIDQQKGQLDIASALSRGDIAAAAQATLSLQGTMAQQRSGELKDALSQQLEDERLSIETQIEEKQKQIEKINESIKNKQKEIEKIKERQLALEEKMYQLELLRSAIEIKRAMQNAGDLKQREEYLANQESLNAMNAIGFDSSLFGENAGKLGAAWNAIIASAAIPYEKYTSPLGSTMGVTSASVPMTTTLPTSASVVNITARSVIIGSGKQTDGEGDGTGLTNTPGDVAGNTYGDTGSNEFGGKIQNPIQIIKLFISNIKKSLAILTDKDLGLIKIFKDAIEVFASKDQAGKAKVGIREIFETLLKTIADVHNAFIRAARETLNKVKITLPETIINVKLNKTTVTIAEQILPIKVPEIQTFAMGGNVNYKGSKERAPGLAFGSFVPGMGNTDKVPAMLTPGEFVVRKSVAQAYGSQLEALNGQVNPQAGSSVYPGVPTRYRSNGIDSLVSVGSLSSFNPFTDLSNVDTSIVDLSRVNANTFPVITNVSSDSYPVDASYSNSQNVLNSFSPVQYTYNVSVNAETNANPDQIARAVVTQINSRDRRNIRGTKING